MAVAATLLVEGIDALVAHGVPRERLMRKVRLDREIWGTWAEIRAADLVLRAMRGDVALQIEEGRSRGAHADLRFVSAGSTDATSIEVKAIGLSDDEVDFCRRMSRTLESILPDEGHALLHASIDSDGALYSGARRREVARLARRAARGIPTYPHGLRGVSIVGHGSEASYVRRVGRRVVQAVRQLPVTTDECWVAIFWSNGAPVETVFAAIPWDEIPTHIVGLIFVGCGVILGDPQVHCFTTRLPRDSRASDPLVTRSAATIPGADEVAGMIFSAFEQSSGVRPTLLRAGTRTLLHRIGQQRILPFNLLLSPDPEGIGRNSPTGPWIA